MFVKPTPGIKVRDPISMLHLPDDGREVPESSYWLRRIRSGDVAVCDAPMVQVDQIPDSRKGEE